MHGGSARFRKGKTHCAAQEHVGVQHQIGLGKCQAARHDPTLAYASPSLSCSMDVATASLLDNWIDEAEQRTWFLFEAARAAE
jgi:hypothetical protein